MNSDQATANALRRNVERVTRKREAHEAAAVFAHSARHYLTAGGNLVELCLALAQALEEEGDLIRPPGTVDDMQAVGTLAAMSAAMWSLWKQNKQEER